MEDTKKLYRSLSTATTTTTTTTTTTAEDPILKDTTNLCQTLFNQLYTKFLEFFSLLPLHNHEPDDETMSLPSPDSRLWPLVQHLSLILRCSLVVLTLPYPDQAFLINKIHRIFRILNSFTSVTGTTFLLFHNFLSDLDIKLSHSCRPFLCAVLEVFADELLRHQSLRRYLMRADTTYSNCEKMFVCRSTDDDIVCVLEVISAHFILSVSNEKAFENFISRLCLHCDEDVRFPELGLGPAMALLLDPVVYSAPKMFQAHVLSLVSEAIESGLSSENLDPDLGFYLMAFQKSASLYSMHVSCLQMDSFNIELSSAYNGSLFERGHPTFESYIQGRTSNKLNQVLSQSKNSLDSYQCKISSKTKADLLAEYIEYMKARQCIFADSRHNKAASILDYIINQTFSQDAAGDDVKQNTSAEDISLLASILKLMSVLLLKTIKCLSNSGDSVCLKTMGSSSVRDDYDFLISIIEPFQELKFCLPIQTSFYDMMKIQQSNYKVSKSMLVYFSGLLSLSFYNGYDVLAKGCISVIMALMSMFIFEEGDLVDLGSSRSLSLKSCTSEVSLYKSQEGPGNKQSIYKVAAEFHRIRTCNLRMDSIVADGSEETCKGKAYLDCTLTKREADYDELADFIVCKKGKDYSSWLNNRLKFRQQKYQKVIGSKEFKKERVWKSLRLRKLVSYFEANVI
ncbi:unnamed protein product [Trifolium pratense]|uniref:Uncharacterized protein n=1 Tax=Trifolium pratense TaxID=57577 RepID=A0ACB0I9R9_TRIPR|nr:unnamed protein product [Trifolium pratense]